MKRAYNLSCIDRQHVLTYLCPEEKPFFRARIFMKGPLMERAKGDPFLSRQLIEANIDFIGKGSGQTIAPHQVHGVDILLPSQNNILPARPRADGIFLSGTDYEGSLRYADCMPVLIASPVPTPWVLMLHSGYKGTVRNIVSSGMAVVRSHIKEQNFNRVYAWVGPGIGTETYWRDEGDEWSHQGIKNLSSIFYRKEGKRIYFNLLGAIREQLQVEGLQGKNINSIPICTYKDEKICYSYRRGDLHSRMFFLASL